MLHQLDLLLRDALARVRSGVQALAPFVSKYALPLDLERRGLEAGRLQLLISAQGRTEGKKFSLAVPTVSLSQGLIE